MRPSEASSAAFRARQAGLASWLSAAGIAACVIDDAENLRTSSLRWLSGHPMDGVLFVFASGRSVLVPWDVNTAAERAVVDQVIPSADFKRSFDLAVTGVLRDNGVSAGARVEFLSRTSHLRWQDLQRLLPGVEVVLRPDGFETYIGKMRIVKDATEIAAIEKAAAITDTLLDKIGAALAAPGGADGMKELDMAHLVEREGLALGAEGIGFETLAAGPARSWAIHPFPAFSAGPFATARAFDPGLRGEGGRLHERRDADGRARKDVRGAGRDDRARGEGLRRGGYSGGSRRFPPGACARG